MNELKLEAGKFYRTRGGQKVRCLATDRPGSLLHIVCMEMTSGGICTYDSAGKFNPFLTAVEDYDLIAEWSDAPIVDWSLFSPWVNALAKDSDGAWREYIEAPQKTGFGWANGDVYACRRIPAAFCPKYSGPWQQSLVVRPGKEKA